MPFLRWISNRRTHIDFAYTYRDIVIKYDNPVVTCHGNLFLNIIISRKTFQTQPAPTRPDPSIKNGAPHETCSGADLLRRRVFRRSGERLYYRLST